MWKVTAMCYLLSVITQVVIYTRTDIPEDASLERKPQIISPVKLEYIKVILSRHNKNHVLKLEKIHRITNKMLGVVA